MEHWAKSFFEKITLKHLQNTFGHFWERFWACLEFWNFFLFLKIFEDSTHHGTLGKKFFRKKHPKTTSKHVWTLLGTILGVFGILKLFLIYFENFRRLDPPWNTVQKIFSKKSPLNLFKTRWDTFWNEFGHFWNLETFFFWKFSKTRPTMEHWAKSFFEKITLKQLQNTFGHFWERFWAFLEFWNFFLFLKIFEDSTHHGTLGKKFFRKKHPKTTSKHVWTLLGTILGVFGILKLFLISSKIFGDSTLHGTLYKKFFRKNHP